MIAEIGLLALILALFVAAVQSVIPLIGAARGEISWMRLGSSAAITQFGLVAVAFAALIWLHVVSDFSVLNVVQQNHTDKPPLYKIAGAWGNHEGSMVLWTFILALYGMAVAVFGRTLPPGLRARVLSVQGMIAFGFLLFILMTSNPFERINPPNPIPSVLIGKSAPALDLPPLYAGRPRFTTADFNGHVTLVNFFASWCVPCRAEHPVLRNLAGKGIVLIGINYKDKPEDAQAFLAELGNPYRVIAADANGRTGTDFGVYGVPETYLIDKNGVIRYRQAGPLTDDIARKEILSLAERLK